MRNDLTVVVGLGEGGGGLMVAVKLLFLNWIESSWTKFAIVASPKGSACPPSPRAFTHCILFRTVVGTERRRGCSDGQIKAQAGRDRRPAVTVIERESADSWDSSRGESIDPGEWADSHFTASAVTPPLGYGTEPYIPSGQGDLDPIRFCRCATTARKVMNLRAKSYFPFSCWHLLAWDGVGNAYL